MPAAKRLGEAVEFRLTYEGILLGASRDNKRPKHKHEIRKTFHKQLKRLFEFHPAFVIYRETEDNRLQYEKVIRANQKFGFNFFPLATRQLSLTCGISILFLRPDVPGDVMKSGDIDNRLKTIFDALRVPHNEAELGGHAPGDDEDPFFCLLEDDSLITNVSAETDTLLQPTGDEWEKNDTRLVMTIRLQPYHVTFQNIAFG